MLPVCKALGYDVVAFGVMATVNLAIGQVTPPVGVNLFVAIGIKIKKGMEVTLQEISKAVMPMLAACVAVLLVVTYIPVTSTALPRALAKNGAYSGDSSSGDSGSSAASAAGDGDYSFNEIADYSDLGWEETTWNFACSTTETSTWADGGRKFGELMEKATGGKVKVNIYAADQLTNGNQSEGIQALMNGDPVQISMHSNLIYSAFDPRFNVVSLPFIYDSVEDADAKFDGEAGEKLKEILGEYGLHCMGIAENGFRELTNSVREVKSVDDMKNLKIRVAGSNLLMECYKRWGADATNLNWSETYTALQQNTVEGQENPLPAIDAASVQEVQPYCSMWDAIYDCLFFCINQDIYDGLTPEQQAVVDKAGRMAVEYERYINRSGANEIMNRWEEKNGVTFTAKEDMDIDSFVTPASNDPSENKLNSGVDLQFCVMDDCENKEAAYEVLDFLLEDENIQTYLDDQKAVPCKEGDFTLPSTLDGMKEYIEEGRMADYQDHYYPTEMAVDAQIQTFLMKKDKDAFLKKFDTDWTRYNRDIIRKVQDYEEKNGEGEN